MTGHPILVTGGGTGICRGLADAFHQQGNQGIIAGRQQSVLNAAVEANSERFVSEITREFPALNDVVNNAWQI